MQGNPMDLFDEMDEVFARLLPKGFEIHGRLPPSQRVRYHDPG